MHREVEREKAGEQDTESPAQRHRMSLRTRWRLCECGPFHPRIPFCCDRLMNRLECNRQQDPSQRLTGHALNGLRWRPIVQRTHP